VAARAPGSPPRDELLPVFGHAMQSLALYEAGRREEALTLLAELTPRLDESAPAGSAWILAELATVRATLLLAEDRAAEAVAPARQALAERLKEQAELPRLVGRNRGLLAAALAGSGRRAEARPLLAESLTDALDCGYLTPLQRTLLLRAQSAFGP
jgi:ATP/maltotriose-dependent transcriptional regulator MalT